MLKTEQAQQQIETWWVSEEGDSDSPISNLAADLKKLPVKLRHVCYAIFGLGADGEEDYGDDSVAFENKQKIILGKLTTAERKKLLAVMFGKLAGDVEYALTWIVDPCRFHAEGDETIQRRKPTRQEKVESQFSFLEDLKGLANLDRSILNIEWFAAWVGHLRKGWEFDLAHDDSSFKLLASAIDRGSRSGKAVLQILLDSGNRDHEIGVPGAHVNASLLMASSETGWDFVERLLLAAQRQEGLRQTIMESLPNAHVGAFVKVLRTILEQNLTRFSSVMMGLNQWFGMAWDVKQSKRVNEKLRLFLAWLEKPTAVRKQIDELEPEQVYLALFAVGFHDESKGCALAKQLMEHENSEIRFVVAAYLSHLISEQATSLRIRMVSDGDLQVMCAALFGVCASRFYVPDIEVRTIRESDKLLVALKSKIDSVPRKTKKLEPVVWDWVELKISQSIIADQMLSTVNYPGSKRSAAEIAEWIPLMSPSSRYVAVRDIADQKRLDKTSRSRLFEFAGDKAGDVVEASLNRIKSLKISDDESRTLESLLSRKSTEVRQGVMDALLNQNDTRMFTAIERLLGDGQKPRRLAGLELLRRAAESGHDPEQCSKLAAAYESKAKKLTKDERLQLDAISKSGEPAVSFDDCLGLCDRSKRTAPVAPKNRKVKAMTSATLKFLKALDDHLTRSKATELTFAPWGREKEMQTELIGKIDWGFPTPTYNKKVADQFGKFPSIDFLRDWYGKLPASCKDSDGFHLLRAKVYLDITTEWDYDELQSYLKKSSRKSLARYLGLDKKTLKLKNDDLVSDMVVWLMRLEMPKKPLEFCLDVVESVFAQIPADDVARVAETPKQIKDSWGDMVDPPDHDFRGQDGLMKWFELGKAFVHFPEVKPPKDFELRSWRLLHWWDEPVPGASRNRPPTETLAAAFAKKQANLDDVYDHLLGPPNSGYSSFGALVELSGRSVREDLKSFAERPPIEEAIRRCVDRVFELEIARGGSSTTSSSVALGISCYRGIEKLRQLLVALGKKGFKSNNSYRRSTEEMREATFTEMVSNTYPAADETPADFAKIMNREIKSGHIPQERLLQLAFLAPQWLEFVTEALQWEGFEEAVYWYMAHLKYAWGLEAAFEDEDDDDENEDLLDDVDDEDAPEKLSRWERIIRERTHLTSDDRHEGAIDVDWFHRVYAQVSAKRWEAMGEASRFAATAAQAKRAKLIGDVLLGKVAKKQLVDGIKKRNLKENVRLLGLLPMAAGTKRDKDLMDRYENLEAYRRYANKLSSMSRPEALRALEIGMQNLASTAGYADPIRLQWALEAASTADLAAGPIEVKKGDVKLVLELESDATPVTTVFRGDKVLKTLPKAVARDKKFVELRERAKHLKRQASRIKQSLETAMCRGDAFTGAELATLSEHALLWPQLQRLVLVNGTCLGYPVRKGKALRNFAGKTTSVKNKDELRIAHPFDLLRSKKWPEWQRECFNIERLQPFKQVFRELYVVTAQEKKDKLFSNRYAGHQVNRKQALALWGQRGWAIDDYENAWKTFHAESISVSVEFEYGVTTPLEIEGLTIEKVVFQKRGEYKPLPVTKVPPVLFSEVMRDLDLVVSVAHVGEVDPEASASTVELRRALISETCQLLDLNNVQFKAKSNNVVIKGELGDYSVHLGSGVVHRLPGGSVCLVPVHSQHRGRLFLPFADNDPKTAEVISKTLLLARDDEIDDPILLEQIR